MWVELGSNVSWTSFLGTLKSMRTSSHYMKRPEGFKLVNICGKLVFYIRAEVMTCGAPPHQVLLVRTAWWKRSPLLWREASASQRSQWSSHTAAAAVESPLRCEFLKHAAQTTHLELNMIDADETFASAFINRYSAQKDKMLQSCLCCKEVKTMKKKVNMKCGNGNVSKVESYIYVKECNCQICNLKK